MPLWQKWDSPAHDCFIPGILIQTVHNDFYIIARGKAFLFFFFFPPNSSRGGMPCIWTEEAPRGKSCCSWGHPQALPCISQAYTSWIDVCVGQPRTFGATPFRTVALWGLQVKVCSLEPLHCGLPKRKESSSFTEDFCRRSKLWFCAEIWFPWFTFTARVWFEAPSVKLSLVLHPQVSGVLNVKSWLLAPALPGEIP